MLRGPCPPEMLPPERRGLAKIAVCCAWAEALAAAVSKTYSEQKRRASPGRDRLLPSVCNAHPASSLRCRRRDTRRLSTVMGIVTWLRRLWALLREVERCPENLKRYRVPRTAVARVACVTSLKHNPVPSDL
jgi:hypothetical protein